MGVLPEYTIFDSENSDDRWKNGEDRQRNVQNNSKPEGHPVQKKYSIMLGDMAPGQFVNGIYFAVQVDRVFFEEAASLSFSATLQGTSDDGGINHSLEVGANLIVDIEQTDIPTALIPEGEPKETQIFLPFISR